MTRIRELPWAIGILAGLGGGLAHASVTVALDGSRAVIELGGSTIPIVSLFVHLAISAMMGIAFGWLFARSLETYSESLMNGLILGLLSWLFLALNLVPILLGRGPQWQAEAADGTFPRLMGYLFQGAILGLGYHAISNIATRRRKEKGEPEKPRQPSPAQHHVVILGGGFGGVTTAQHLERRFARESNVAISLISNRNSLLFTPLLSEVASSGIEARHIATALRSFFTRVRVIHADVEAVDFERRVVHLASDLRSRLPDVPYDHLVFAVGSVPTSLGLDSTRNQAFTFRSLDDALLLRNHVVEMLERADSEPDASRRRALLTFVVAGGGFAGVELIGGLNDLVRGSLLYFPNIPAEDVSIILVHSGSRILPELSRKLGEYSHKRLMARGVTCKCETRVGGASPGRVLLDSGEEIASETLVLATGNSPNPLIRESGLGVNKRGLIEVDAMLSVPKQSGMWAIGDCASIPDDRTGQTYPQTAQHATREAATLAHNIAAAIKGGRLKKFRYRSLGTMVVLGHQTAAAELCGIRFSGLLAWWMWRTIYLAKLPGLEKKLRVALDWTMDLFFPRDIVQTRTSTRLRAHKRVVVDGPTRSTNEFE